jgi:cellulose synthase/poly-beta-1,6-N-acetylglucosamine synthase-like glycosyltransferase
VTSLLRAGFSGFSWIVLWYFLVLNSWYLVLIVLASFEALGHFRALPFAGYDDIFSNPLTPPVSVVVPARNEAAGIVESVRALLALRYPELEIIVVDDGSTDATFAVLHDAFGLATATRAFRDDVPTRGLVRSVYAPIDGSLLTVIRKEGVGRRSDAANVGLNAARHPLVCFIDADAILDEEALLRVVKPFVDDPARVVASGGSIRAANGCAVDRGRMVDARMPRRWLERIQVVEYLRSFLLGRAGWSRLRGLLIISGAFGLFRRDVLVEIGGFDLACVGEDAELVTHLHRHLREARREYEIVFVAEPVCWTEVPSTRQSLASQRRRWSSGLYEVVRTHRRMIANPRYGRIGLVVLPYFVVFEMLGAVVELLGVGAVGLGLALGLVDVGFALLFGAVAIGYALLLSHLAMAVEEFSYRRYHRWLDLGTGVVAALLENVGYRQLHAWWRIQGLVHALRGKNATWDVLPRTGFETTDHNEAERIAA